jgi:hypothetical protein
MLCGGAGATCWTLGKTKSAKGGGKVAEAVDPAGVASADRSNPVPKPVSSLSSLGDKDAEPPLAAFDLVVDQRHGMFRTLQPSQTVPGDPLHRALTVSGRLGATIA